MAGYRPVCLANCTNPMLLRSRRRRSFGPMEYCGKPVSMVLEGRAIFSTI